VEANLDLAARLWKIVKPKCAPADSATDEPLDLVLAKAVNSPAGGPTSGQLARRTGATTTTNEDAFA